MWSRSEISVVIDPRDWRCEMIISKYIEGLIW